MRLRRREIPARRPPAATPGRPCPGSSPPCPGSSRPWQAAADAILDKMVPVLRKVGHHIVIYGDAASRIEGDSNGMAMVGASSSYVGF